MRVSITKQNCFIWEYNFILINTIVYKSTFVIDIGSQPGRPPAGRAVSAGRPSDERDKRRLVILFTLRFTTMTKLCRRAAILILE